MTTATVPQFAALLAAIDADPTNPVPVAILGDWFEDHGDVRAGCIQWAMKWGKMPNRNELRGYWFVAANGAEDYHVLNWHSGPPFAIPERNVFRASEAWLALCDRWAEMTAYERETVERESKRVWGGAK